MKKIITLITLALIVATAMLTSCTKTPKEMLTGEYRITEMTNDKKMAPDEAEIWNTAKEDFIKNTVFILNGDGTLQQTYNGVTTKGTWEVYGDDGEEGEGWRLKLIYEDKSTANLEIIALSSSGFTYVEPDQATQSKQVITYTKVK